MVAVLLAAHCTARAAVNARARSASMAAAAGAGGFKEFLNPPLARVNIMATGHLEQRQGGAPSRSGQELLVLGDFSGNPTKV